MFKIAQILMSLDLFLLFLIVTLSHRGDAFITPSISVSNHKVAFIKNRESVTVPTSYAVTTDISPLQRVTFTTSNSPLQRTALSLFPKFSSNTDGEKKDFNPLPPPTYEELFQFRAKMSKYLKKQRRGKDIKELSGDLKHQFEYQRWAEGFNRRFKPRPYFVILCRCTEDVQTTFNIAKEYNIPIRIRASGHDHEGESSGDGLVVIDVSNMDHVEVDHSKQIAHIGPGNKFEDLTTKLANQGVMVPHGTCGTVAIAGFTMGGGWGPYTRSQGMCCEYLVGATIVLGNGHIECIDEESDKLPELLWALRGGGGFSYGLVTELRIKTFCLAEELIRFTITWNPYSDQLETNPTHFPDLPRNDIPTREVLQKWERSIQSSDTKELIGTNLQVTGCPRNEDEEIDYKEVCNNCIMYGYWEGNCDELKAFVNKWYGDEGILYINEKRGGTKFKENDYGKNLMSDWARIDTAPVLRAKAVLNPKMLKLGNEYEQLIEGGSPLPSDVDLPAPHKITNRLVDKSGLQEEGFKAYIESMWSPLILRGNRNLGLNQYVTLGAINGHYYQNHPDQDSLRSSFPYKDKEYIIQYQTWWNANLTEASLEGPGNLDPVILDPIEGPVYTRTNKALDWMEVVREYPIPNTSGAFISFKDSSIPTKTYFQQNYERLQKAKIKFSNDPYNYFRSRKTII